MHLEAFIDSKTNRHNSGADDSEIVTLWVIIEYWRMSRHNSENK